MGKKYYISLFVSLIITIIIGAVIIMAIGFNPIEGYVQLFKGAFVGSFNLGGTLELFVPLMLTALAFAVSSKVGIFNIGVEGEYYLGGLAAIHHRTSKACTCTPCTNVWCHSRWIMGIYTRIFKVLFRCKRNYNNYFIKLCCNIYNQVPCKWGFILRKWSSKDKGYTSKCTPIPYYEAE